MMKVQVQEVDSKYSKDQSVWIKLDPSTKWVPGKISQVLPNQSYEVTLTDGHIFRHNEHHITVKQQGTKWPRVPQPTQVHCSYNLRPRNCQKVN